MSEPSEQRESPSPSAYREQNPFKPPPPAYKPPSMLREHAALAILFVVIAIACAAYGWRALHAPGNKAPSRRAPDPAGPIYVEPIPEKDSP